MIKNLISTNSPYLKSKHFSENTLESLTDDDWRDLRDLNMACKGLFWQSDIDYTIVPCAFKMEGAFSANKFLVELGLDSQAFQASTKFEYFAGGNGNYC